MSDESRDTNEPQMPAEDDAAVPEPVISYVRVRGVTYRVINGIRHREIDGYIRSEVVAELNKVRKNLNAVMEGGQNYSVGSRSLTRISPNTLLAREQYLLGLLARFDNNAGDMRTQRFIPTDN
ncbi:MAG: hypothetical protein IJ228_00695 [Succinivibrio sp.]|nr:hypothetical protein [Succinivibrio sp.]